MTRRQALLAVAAASGYIYGKPLGAASGIHLVLDGPILFEAKGQKIVVTPEEIIAALLPPSTPAQQQLYNRSVK